MTFVRKQYNMRRGYVDRNRAVTVASAVCECESQMDKFFRHTFDITIDTCHTKRDCVICSPRERVHSARTTGVHGGSGWESKCFRLCATTFSRRTGYIRACIFVRLEK